MIKSRLAVLLLGLLLLSGANLQAQEEKQAVAIQDMVLNIERSLVSLQKLTAQIDSAPASDQGALVFRRDKRSFELLKSLDELVRRTAELPPEDPVRVDVEQRLREDFSGLEGKLFSRINQLVKRISESTDELASLSGARLISGQAYVQALRALRLQYYGALVDLIEGRDALGMESTEVSGLLSTQLYLHAEALVGKIEFSGQALDTVGEQLGADPQNAELMAASHQFKTLHRQDLHRLEAVVALMGRMSLDASVYKSTMLQQGQKLSIRDIESEVVLDLLAEAWLTVKEALHHNAPDLLFNLLIFVLIVLTARMLARLVRKGVRAACERSGADISTLLKDVLVSVSGGIVVTIGFLMALSQIGISLAPMLAGLGVAGFIVGFALQDTLGNFASGSMILIYRPYDVDDFVEVVGASGLVKKMSLVSTTITTFDNQTLVIPNSKIWGDVIKNVTAQKVRRVDMLFGVGYDADIEQVERVLADIVSSHELVLAKPAPMIHLHELADSSINFIVRPWSRTEDYWSVYWDVTREIKMRFDREGISIPFPQRDVHLFQQPS